MTTGLHNTGEEYIVDVLFDGSISRVTSVDMTLFNDSTDSLSETSDLSAISTEPAGGSFSRQTVNLNTTDVTNSKSGGDYQSDFAKQTFDTSDSSQSVDSYAIIVNFDSDEAGDGGTPSDHLFFTGGLGGTSDLSQIDTFEVTNAGATVS